MPKSTVKRALLVDFAGTLFLPLDGKQWLTAGAHRAKTDISTPYRTKLAPLLDIRFHHVRDPGRDLSPAAHRQSMLPALESLVTDKTLAMALYDLQFTDEFWHLRNGARELLCCAHDQDLRVVVVSNVPWDIRPLFINAGLQDQIHGFALSCEVGIEKPDKLIFEHALGIADCTPAEAVLIGDDPVTDSGALDLGIPVVLIPPVRESGDQSLLMIANWLLNAGQHKRSRCGTRQLDASIAVDGLRRWQRFLDRHLHADRDPQDGWTDFPPRRPRELADLPARWDRSSPCQTECP